MCDVLVALGYDTVIDDRDDDPAVRMSRAIERMAKRYRLTSREQDVLAGVLGGMDNEELRRDLDISRATVKWHMHNVFAKTDTGNRESLLRLALGLPSSAELRAQLAAD